MPVLSLTRARLAYGHRALLDGADFLLEPREHVALIGRNGTGKSSMLHVLAGDRDLDDGERWLAPGMRVALLEQEPPLVATHTVYEAVALGLGPEGALLTAYHDATARLAHTPHDAQVHSTVNALQAQLDQGGWTLGHRVDTVISRLGLAPDAIVGSLSGGWKKRVALAQALAAEPDILLIDEPTNHLDITAISWLEELIASFAGALVCVTHDRRFLDVIAQRIVELDRGHLRSYPGTFAQYRIRKAAEENEEALANARFDKLLADEEVWIRKGVEARRTRNEGRVLRLEALRRERAQRRERLGDVRFNIADAERSGRLVAELLNVHKSYGERRLIHDFSTRVMRGDRIGLIGPNGAGKSTLLKLILGEIEPDSGSVRRGTQLDIAYFDQLREALDPEATLAESISPGADFIEIGESRRHVITYLGDFMFAPERARSPVRSLSGGERNRLLLARLFARPANVLVLDEPTNDLDIETLELLESLLLDYSGTLFLVSHDRAFLDNVVTQTIAFEGNGVLREYAGGYSDWEAYQRAHREPSPSRSTRTDSKARSSARNTATTAGKQPALADATGSRASPPSQKPRDSLSFREQRELEGLPAIIEALEGNVRAQQLRLADPALYSQGADAVVILQRDLDVLERQLATAYARWENLESRVAQTTGR